MFSIAAINDVETPQEDWQHLAPTKEAQEFQLTQMYNESLVHLQAGEYKQAQVLLEAIIQDPLSANAEMENVANSDPMRQLRFLVFRNLAEAFYKQGPDLHKDALQCFLHAVSIDAKDVTIWNRLGSLACLLGSYNVARWAFEQGLNCSPQHWACMEKLVEVLIAIGDEAACLYAVKRLLKISPSHPRALLVRRVIEENIDPVEMMEGEESSNKYSRMLRGIDKLKPLHHSLSFSKKRKREDLEFAKESSHKNVLKLNLDEPSLAELLNTILKGIERVNAKSVVTPATQDHDAVHATGKSIITNAAVIFTLWGKSINEVELQTQSAVFNVVERQHSTPKVDNDSSSVKALKVEGMATLDSSTDRITTTKERDISTDEEPQLERRSTRLERIRTRKFDKSEELENIQLEESKIKVSFEGLMKLLEPYIICKENLDDAIVELLPNMTEDEKTRALDYVEGREVIGFLREHIVNSGLYHVGQKLLEKISLNSIKPFESWTNLIRLEKCIRNVSTKSSPFCNLFLAEIYMDMMSSTTGEHEIAGFLEDCDYHLCNIIGCIAVEISSYDDSAIGLNPEILDKNQNLVRKIQIKGAGTESCLWSFWVRFYWASGRLHYLQGTCEKGREDFYKCLEILESREHSEIGADTVILTHCRTDNKISAEIVRHKIHEVQIQDLLSHQAAEMLEEGRYSEMIELLAPILFIDQANTGSTMTAAIKKRSTDFSTELKALEMLLIACEKSEPRNFNVALQCFIRRMQIHFSTAGIVNLKGAKSILLQSVKLLQSEGMKEDSFKVIAKEVKHISRSLSKFDQHFPDKINMSPDVKLLGYMQQLLLTIMCHISMLRASRRSTQFVPDASEQPEAACFVDASVSFCRLQQFSSTTSIKQQVELLVRVHDVLAESGLCCAGKTCEGGEGVFLKMAIKHFLHLEMKLKTAMPNSVVNDFVSKLNDEASTEVVINSISTDHDLLKGDETSINEKMVEGFKESHSDKKRKLAISEQVCDIEKKKTDIGLDMALDQSFFCLYGLNLRGGLDSTGGQDGLAMHINTSLGEYQTKEQCAEVFQYLLPYARVCTKSSLTKLRKVLRAIRRHFSDPPEKVLKNNAIDAILDSLDIDEAKLSCMVLNHANINEVLGYVLKKPSHINSATLKVVSTIGDAVEAKEGEDEGQQYKEVYENMYYLLYQVEETCASDKWPGFVLSKEGEEFVEQNAKLFKYDLVYNVSRFESWQNLANLYDEEVDLMLNDASKTTTAMGWHKDTNLIKRVEVGRRHTRRCLLMSLALAKTQEEECQVHEHLALVYYDSVQNVAPSYNQRQYIAVRDLAWREACQKSFVHFKKALSFKLEWMYLFYMGKLSEKLGKPCEKYLAYYKKAADMNPSAVDTLYRLHASRLKLLCSRRMDDKDIIKVVSKYSYVVGTKEKIDSLLQFGQSLDGLETDVNADAVLEAEKSNIEDAWNILFDDCVKALEACIEGDLKHYHKARFRLAQALFSRNRTNDKEKAKEELGFCFKSNRSLFTINMWEIDGATKKNRRKTPGSSGLRRGLEVLMPESSRKFITCLRKYLQFYLHLCEKTFDLCTLERAHCSLRVDKKFSLCLADMINVALGKYIHTLGAAISRYDRGETLPNISLNNLTERFFNLFMEHGGSWSDIVSTSLTEAGFCSTDEVSDKAIYSHIHHYLHLLECDNKVDVLESINEKIKKRFKNLKLVKESCTSISKHAAIAWCRALCVSLCAITPIHRQDHDGALPSSSDQLVVELQTDDIMNCSSDLFLPKTECDTIKQHRNRLSCMNRVRIKQALSENMDQATNLLRQAFTFYRDCAGPFPSGISLFLVPVGSNVSANNVDSLTTLTPSTCSLVGVDLSVPRKLLLWAYTLVHGHTCSIAEAVKFCEEQAKNKAKKGLPSHASPPVNCTEKIGGSGAPKEASGTGYHQSMNNEVVDEREKVLLVEDPDVLGGSEMHNITGPSSRSTEE